MGTKRVAALVAGVLLVAGAQQAGATPSFMVRMSDNGTGTATAACPGAMNLYGVGGSSSTEISLSEDPTAGTATAVTTGNNSVTAYAICGTTLNPTLTDEYVLGGSKQTSVQVACDPGSQVHSVEAEILPSGSGVVITGIVPTQGLKGVTVEADPVGVVGNARWNISATAQCG